MTILEEILAVKKEEVSVLKKNFSLNSFREFKYFYDGAKSFIKEVEKNKNISVIAEIKKASPSKGLLRKNFNHLKIAEEYFASGVNAVSVLTDEKFFGGNINFLNEIASKKEVPLLRKDFIIDEYQVFEAKGNGADFILLICEALSKAQINELTHAAFECGLEVLLELHSFEEISKVDLGINRLIGVNNRNLKTFKVDLNTTAQLSDLIRENTILVSESGINRKEDLDFLKKHGINAILVGEHFMRSDSIKSNVEEMKRWCSLES